MDTPIEYKLYGTLPVISDVTVLTCCINRLRLLSRSICCLALSASVSAVRLSKSTYTTKDDIQQDRQTDRQTDRPTDRQTDRQTDRLSSTLSFCFSLISIVLVLFDINFLCIFQVVISQIQLFIILSKFRLPFLD